MTRPKSITQLLLTSAIVAIGAVVAWGMAVLWGLTVAEIGASRVPHEQLLMRYDGEPLIERYPQVALRAEHRQLFTLDGERAEGVALSTHVQFLQPPDVLYTSGARIASTSDNGNPATYWYLLHDGRPGGRAYGIGYNSYSKQRAGYFSRSGFTTELPPREDWFVVAGDKELARATPMTGSNEPFYSGDALFPLIADGQLWLIDTHRQEVKSLGESPGGYAVGWTSKMLEELPKSESQVHPVLERRLLVRSPERLTIVDPKTARQTTRPIPPEFRDNGLAVFELADDGLLLVAGPKDQSRPEETTVVWLDVDGAVTRRREVQLSGGIARSSLLADGAIASLAMPLLPGSVLFNVAIAGSRVESGEEATWAAAIANTVSQTWPAIAMVLAVSAALAVIAWRRQRHYALPHAVLWAAFVFVFGLPGFLAYRVHRTWPVLEPCPRCNEPSPRDRDRCTDCGATFPPPELKGLEVYA